MAEIRVVFDGPPGPVSGRFVECETPEGRSINAGEWRERDDGFWELRIPTPTNDGEGLIERLREAAKPWADYHGDLPDYDHPLRPVFESGVQYAVELLAKMLHVEDWEICDGTEEFDGDLGGTLLNIVIKTWPTDQNGDWLDLRDPETRAALNQGAGR
jgi:hypothetical protein